MCTWSSRKAFTELVAADLVVLAPICCTGVARQPENHRKSQRRGHLGRAQTSWNSNGNRDQIMLEDAFGSRPAWSHFQPYLCELAAKRKLILTFRHTLVPPDEEVFLQPRGRQK